MNNYQINLLICVVGALLFLLQGIEMKLLKADVNKLTNALRDTLNELSKRFDTEAK